jgi:hypothetical protein
MKRPKEWPKENTEMFNKQCEAEKREQQNKNQDRIETLKVQIFDIMEKQGIHQGEIKKLEQQKINIYEELNRLRGGSG